MFETFTEKGFIPPSKPLFLPDEEYSRGLSTFVFGCADTVLISDEYPKKIILVKRNNDPMAGHWWTFGGRMQFGERPNAAAARIFERETGINNISHADFKAFGIYNFMCRTRAQEPKNAGSHSIVLLHALLLEPERIRAITLDRHEYSGNIMTGTPDDIMKKARRGEIHEYFISVVRDLYKNEIV